MNTPRTSNEFVSEETRDALYRAERLKSLQLLLEGAKRDNDLIAARLNRAAQERRLRVTRCKDVVTWFHSVELIHEDENGEVYATQIGGYIYKGELERGGGDKEFPFKKETVEGGKVRIPLMITDTFPNHPFFLREDGVTRVYLGPIDDLDHYHCFDVTLFEEDLTDEF